MIKLNHIIITKCDVILFPGIMIEDHTNFFNFPHLIVYGKLLKFVCFKCGKITKLKCKKVPKFVCSSIVMSETFHQIKPESIVYIFFSVVTGLYLFHLCCTFWSGDKWGVYHLLIRVIISQVAPS